MNREAWRAAIHGVADSDTTERLTELNFLLGTHSSNDRTHGFGLIDLAVVEPLASVGTGWRAVLTSKLGG